MTKEEQEELTRFTTRLRQLLLQYKELEQKNRDLEILIVQRQQALVDANVKMQEIQEAYNALKVSRMIEVSDTDLKEARGRINKLVHEIDKCISLLNV